LEHKLKQLDPFITGIPQISAALINVRAILKCLGPAASDTRFMTRFQFGYF